MKKYSIDDFIKLTKADPNSWKRYCEIIIDNDGSVILARPSHQQCLLRYYCEKENISMDKVIDGTEITWSYSPEHFIIDKYALVSVWYTMVLYSEDNLSDAQRKSIEILKNNNLISSLCEEYATHEYRLYLEREGK